MDWFFSNRIENLIIKADTQSFENLFSDVMKTADDNFNKVKPHGFKGDYKCDGFNSITGEYYCVYAPEDFEKEYTVQNGLKKIKSDIDGIINKWPNIKKIYYVINDKFKGLHPDIQLRLNEIISQSSIPIERYSMEKFKDFALKLSQDKKQTLFGYAPDLTNSVSTLQFNIIEEVIKYLEKSVNLSSTEDKLVVPDFDEKIEYNKLSHKIKDLLNNARYQISKVDDFFDLSHIYTKEDLKKYCSSIYMDACSKYKENECNYADKRFYYILENMSYNLNSKAVNDNVVIIMANFFESCDIFEEPVKLEKSI